MLTHRMPDWQEFGLLALWACVAFVAGGLVFKQLKKGFADVL